MTLYKSLSHNGAYIPTICTNRLIYSKWTFFILSFLDLSHNFTNLVFVTSSILYLCFLYCSVFLCFLFMNVWWVEVQMWKLLRLFPCVWLSLKFAFSLATFMNILFLGIPSTVPQVPENWTKGKLLGAGAFGQVRCKLSWASFKLCPVWSPWGIAVNLYYCYPLTS